VAEVLNARLGNALADLLAEVSARDAERQKQMQEFQARTSPCLLRCWPGTNSRCCLGAAG